ncbi:MAG: tRNA uridine-5-carboxymethylaminomethyl(34) synthesis GTPase MnmE [Desulfobulbus propionicus]|nr:MAG: tRNA uridine-5-carboxymethylaminomethyl(34) synthesis GTPase MnmE [Desulfobulbus propionicus]
MATVPEANETIAAIATAPGAGGIGIVRLSGPQSARILHSLFRPKRSEFTSHQLYYGTIAGADGQILDEVLAVLMQAPRSYTREDVVEIHCHGSALVLHKVLHEVLLQGARVAEPGEFTKRAFLAGRIDLTRAEAVIDLVQARTDAGAAMALSQMQGVLSQEIEAVHQALIDCLALLEVAIDFPDEDMELLDTVSLVQQLEKMVEVPLQELIGRSVQGKILREGIKVVLAGRPNVGKSSLLNRLLQEERALVNEQPGTTRDTLEEWVDVRGIPVQLVDTAGIRDHADPVEGLGIERARQKVATADLVLFMVDGDSGCQQEDLDLYASLADRPHLVVINKVDIAEPTEVRALQERFTDGICLSARRGDGLDLLFTAVEKNVLGAKEGACRERPACAPSLRHRTALEKTLEAVQRTMTALHRGEPADLLAVEVQSALDHLGDIVGLTTPEDVLDTIFTRFCLGK